MSATACIAVAASGCNLITPPSAASGVAAAAAPAAGALAPAAAPAAAPRAGGHRLFRGVCTLIDRMRNRLGVRFPGLEAKEPIKSITDPANLESPNPAVAAAAEVKAEEDAAPQKIKAMRYLASLGCTDCYPDIEDSLLAGLDDCTEEVRFEAAKAIRKTTDDSCNLCNDKSCCTPNVLKKMNEVAFETKADGCYKEPSARVRRQARLVLCQCNGTSITEEGPAVVPEGPSQPPADVTVGTGVKQNTDVAESGPTSSEKKTPTLASVLKKATADQDPTAETAAEDETAADEETAPDDAVVLASHDQPTGDETEEVAETASFDSSWIEERYGSRVLAMVNSMPIRAADLEIQTDTEVDKAAAVMTPRQLDALRMAILKKTVEHTIDQELLIQEAQRKMGDYAVELVDFQRPLNADNRAMSIAPGDNQWNRNDKRAEVARQWLREQTDIDEPIDSRKIASYYRANFNSFQQPARVRWECVSARKEVFKTKKLAMAALSFMKARAEGKDMETPADFNAKKLRVKTYDWSQREDVASEPLAQVLFRMPEGQVSSIIEDGDGWHIVRVQQRHLGRPKPLAEVTKWIEMELSKQRLELRRKEYIARLRSRANIWTTFDSSWGQARDTRLTRVPRMNEPKAFEASVTEAKRLPAPPQ